MSDLHLLESATQNRLGAHKKQRRIFQDLLMVVPAVLILWLPGTLNTYLLAELAQVFAHYAFVAQLDMINASYRDLFWLGMVFAGCTITATLLRHRFPIICFLVALIATMLSNAFLLSFDIGFLLGLCFVVVAERHGRRGVPSWLVIAGCTLALAISAMAFFNPNYDLITPIFSLVFGEVYALFHPIWMLLNFFVLAWSWEIGVRNRRSQQQAAREAELAERLRLRREIHDVLSHSLSTIGVRAGVAAQVQGLTQSEFYTLLREIERSSREGLLQLRTVLAEEAEVTPRAIRQQIDALVDQARGTGLRVVLRDDTQLTLKELPAMMASAVYRLIQEGLTNVVRHANAENCLIELSRSATYFEVQLSDDGRGAEPLHLGHGLHGMQQRLCALGGTISFDGDGGGFRIVARIPWPEDS